MTESHGRGPQTGNVWPGQDFIVKDSRVVGDVNATIMGYPVDGSVWHRIRLAWLVIFKPGVILRRTHVLIAGNVVEGSINLEKVVNRTRVM